MSYDVTLYVYALQLVYISEQVKLAIYLIDSDKPPSVLQIDPGDVISHVPFEVTVLIPNLLCPADLLPWSGRWVRFCEYIIKPKSLH